MDPSVPDPRFVIDIFIGPESDHWECLSLTNSLTHSLTDCRLVNSLVQIWKVNFGYKVNICSDFEDKFSRFGQDLEVDVQARF